jgi:cytidylate kinase
MHDLLAVYVDGETKTGKGAAGKAMAEALKNKGLNVYYDVAGDFYRRYTAWVRIALGLNEDDALPNGDMLEKVATEVYKSGQAFKIDNERLGNLQRPAISKFVSQLGELPVAQYADEDWCSATIEQAAAQGAEVIVIDGRNPRVKLQAASTRVGIALKVVLDLFMTCDTAEAGRRLLLSRGVNKPSAEQVKLASDEIAKRRAQDRQRPVNPFVTPAVSVPYDLNGMDIKEVITASWRPRTDAELPVAINIDNTGITEPEMLAAVRELALAALEFARK